MELKVAQIENIKSMGKEPTNIIKSVVSKLKDWLRVNTTESYAIPSFLSDVTEEEAIACVAIIRTKRKKQERLITLINPSILANVGLIASEERQYGLEGVWLVQRAPKVLYAGHTLPSLEAIKAEVVGKSALVVQQAIHALNGISLDIVGLRVDDFEEYQEGTPEYKSEVFQYLMEDLKIRFKDIANEESLKYLDAVKFTAEKLDTSIALEQLHTNKEVKEAARKGVENVIRKDAGENSQDKECNKDI